MSKTLAEKKLLILGGNPETRALVDIANSMGIITIVADPNPAAPAKLSAIISVDIDGMNVERLTAFALEQSIDGVLVGVADILVPSYQRICENLHLPCYASEKIIDAFSSKDGFIQACKEYSIPTIPSYKLSQESNLNVEKILYPVIVKPVDNGAGVGMSVCKSLEELRIGIDYALNHSLQKRFIVEKYMQGEDLFAYYTFVDGVPHLSALADRYTSVKQGYGSPVCIGASYPSIHLNKFLELVHPGLTRMFTGLGIKDGVLNIQFFHENGDFYAYDPGFRLQGEGPHLHMLAANGVDNRKMLINFALTGQMYGKNFEEVNDVNLCGYKALTIWILLNHGTIANISGIDKLRKLESFREILPRFVVGDTIEPSMLGTERQVFSRIYLQNKNKEKLMMDLQKLNQAIEVISTEGNSMILDSYSGSNYA